MDKSKLVRRSYEEGNEIGWTQAEISKLESDPTYRKYYKEAARILWSNNPISQTSFEIFRTWFPFADKQLHNEIAFFIRLGFYGNFMAFSLFTCVSYYN
jgi:hypothetical protein